MDSYHNQLSIPAVILIIFSPFFITNSLIYVKWTDGLRAARVWKQPFSTNIFFFFLANLYHNRPASKHLQRVGLPNKCRAEDPLSKQRLQGRHLTFPFLLCKTSCRFVHLKRCMPIIRRLLKVETTLKWGIKFLNKFYLVTLWIKLFGARKYKDHLTQATNKNKITPQLPG